MVSARNVVILVGILTFILAGGVGIIAGGVDRLRFEADAVKQSLNPRGDRE